MSEIQSPFLKFVICLGNRYVNSEFYYIETSVIIKLLPATKFFDCITCNINLNFPGGGGTSQGITINK